MDTATVRIDQKRFLRGRQTLILDGDTLKIEFRQGLSLSEYRFDLRGFGPDPVRMRRMPLSKSIIAGFLTITGAVVLVVGACGTVIDVVAGMLSGLFLLILSGVMWNSIARESFDVVAFQGPGGQFVLWPSHPNKEELKGFLMAISERIRNAQHPQQNVVRQLRQAEIIDDWQYEQAMELLERKDATGREDSSGPEE